MRSIKQTKRVPKLLNRAAIVGAVFSWGLYACATPPPPRSTDRLVKASQIGLLQVVEREYKAGADPHRADSSGNYALQQAIAHDQDEIVGFLLKNGHSAKGPKAEKVISGLLERDQGEVLKSYIQAGAVLSTPIANKGHALHYAAAHGKLSAAKALMGAQIDLDLQDSSGQTALALAATSSRAVALAELFLGAGAQVDIADAKQRTALHLYAEQGYQTIVSRILKRSKKVDTPDSKGRRPSFYAAEAGKLEILQQLLDAGAKASAVDSSGRSLLVGAAQAGHAPVVDSLLKAGAALEQVAPRTALQEAAFWGRPEVIAVLVKAGANPSAKDKKGHTPLFIATHANQPEAVRALGHGNVLIDFHGPKQTTALIDAVDLGYTEVCRVLIAFGANIRVIHPNGDALLHRAASKGYIPVIKLLLHHGAKINQKDRVGGTPLKRAAEAGHYDLVELLLERGASPQLADRWGNRPVDYATRGGHMNIVRRLNRPGR